MLSTVSQGRFAEEQRRMHALVHSGALGGSSSARRTASGTARTATTSCGGEARGPARGRRRDRPGHPHPGPGALDPREAPGPGDRQDRHVRAPGPASPRRDGVPIEDTALGIVTFEDGSILEFCAAVSQQLEREPDRDRRRARGGSGVPVGCLLGGRGHERAAGPLRGGVPPCRRPGARRSPRSARTGTRPNPLPPPGA